MAATLKQIAAKTGLSIPTVHQILNGYNASFADATRKKVLAAAEELNYRPNITARSLVTQRSFLIGILFYARNYTLMTPFLRGLQESVKSNRCSPVFFTHDSTAEEIENLQSVLDRRVDGLVVNAAVESDDSTNAERFAKVAATVPMVEVFGRFVPGVPKVLFDFRTAGRKVTEYLIAAGHTRIGLLISEQYNDADKARMRRLWNLTDLLDGYSGAMKAARLPVYLCKYARWSGVRTEVTNFREVFDSLSKYFKDDSKAPTAVLCLTQENAEAVMRYFECTHVPGDRQLTIATLFPVRPSMSGQVKVVTFPFPTVDVGRLAADALFQRIRGEQVNDMPIEPQDAVVQER